MHERHPKVALVDAAQVERAARQHIDSPTQRGLDDPARVRGRKPRPKRKSALWHGELPRWQMFTDRFDERVPLCQDLGKPIGHDRVPMPQQPRHLRLNLDRAGDVEHRTKAQDLPDHVLGPPDPAHPQPSPEHLARRTNRQHAARRCECGDCARRSCIQGKISEHEILDNEASRFCGQSGELPASRLGQPRAGRVVK